MSILGVRPGSGRRFPTTGDPLAWEWCWLGDLPDAIGADLLDDYGAALAFLNFALFTAWAIVMTWAWGPGRRRWAVVAAVAFPLCLETLQRFPFGGTPSVTDAWTNILGGLVGVLLWATGARLAEVISARRVATPQTRTRSDPG
ncbi:VanZ family protein [Demequina silvatica]|uniref:VanZ family protein n=1 Tax=Demequina silvatica TaxID=1638988 RepID=UPI0012DFEDB7|nr:VanZ family protein [Demequina silvatica]